MKPEQSYIQVGFNEVSRLVKIRVPDESGFIVIQLTPEEARALAEKIESLTVNEGLHLSNGVRWSEHFLSEAARTKIATDLRNCASAAEKSN